MFFYLVQANFTNVLIALFFLVFLMTNKTLVGGMRRRFIMATVVVLFLTVADALDYWCEHWPEPSVLRYLTSATGYTLRPAAIMLMILSFQRHTRKHDRYMYLAMIINAVLAYTSVFTHWMFYFDEVNEFWRGPLGASPFVLSAIYMLILVQRAVIKFRVGDKREAAVLGMIALMSVVSVAMESIFHFKFMINAVGMISIVFYYLYLHTQTYKRDALTQTLNRHSFYNDSAYYQRGQMIVISIDINNLKQINDGYGHAQGDKAISTVAASIYAHLQQRGQLYRVGGDEFMVLCPKTTEPEAKKMMKKILQEVDKNGYSIAWGMASYEPDMNFDQVCSESDARMYENKKQCKG